VTHPIIHPEQLADYGWIRRPSGRYVHPELPAPGCRDRLRVFTEGEALTLTAATMAGRCADCGGVHEPEPVEPAEA
jgi:hypothetical protein